MRKTVRSAARSEHAALGALLKDRRESSGLTQRDVANSLGRTQAFVWKVEQGLQFVDIATLIDYAEAVGATASELISEIEAKKG